MPRKTAYAATCALTLALTPALFGSAADARPSVAPIAAPAAPDLARPGSPPKTPTAVGPGGAVSSVDPYASRVGRFVPGLGTLRPR